MNAKDNDGYTPLQMAAHQNHSEMVSLPSGKGAAGEKYKDGRTPQHYAAGADDIGTMKLLLAKGAKIESKDSSGWTPLHVAAYQKTTDAALGAARLLIEKGARVNDSSKWGGTPQNVAAAEDFVPMAGLLLSHGADINARNQDGETPLKIAVKNGKQRVAAFLKDPAAK